MRQPLVPVVSRFVPGELAARATNRFRMGVLPVTSPGRGVQIGDLDLFRCELAGPPVPLRAPTYGSDCVLLLRASQNICISVKGGPTVVVPASHLVLIRNDTDHLFRFRAITRLVGVIAPLALLTAFAVKPPSSSLATYGPTVLAGPM